MTERKSIALDIHDIVKDNYILADFLMREDLRSRLEKGTYEDLNVLIDHFSEKKNVQAFASIFKSDKYEAYIEDRTKDHTYGLVTETAVEVTLELTGAGLAKLLYKAMKQFVTTDDHEQTVNQFLAEIKQFQTEAVFDVEIGEKLTEDELVKAGRVQFACELIKNGTVDLETIKKLGTFSSDELRIIKG